MDYPLEVLLNDENRNRKERERRGRHPHHSDFRVATHLDDPKEQPGQHGGQADHDPEGRVVQITVTGRRENLRPRGVRRVEESIGQIVSNLRARKNQRKRKHPHEPATNHLSED